MLCYRCQDNMKKMSMNGVLIDQCKNCRGTWLDSGELQMLLYEEKKANIQLVAEAKTEMIMEKQRLFDKIGVCPKCQEGQMIEIFKQNIELDQCCSCGGLFFDYGELNKVLKNEEKDFKHCIKKFLSSIFKKK